MFGHDCTQVKGCQGRDFWAVVESNCCTSFPGTLQELSSPIRKGHQEANKEICTLATTVLTPPTKTLSSPRVPSWNSQLAVLWPQILVLLLYLTIFIFLPRNTHLQIPGDQHPKSVPDPTFHTANGSFSLDLVLHKQKG